MWYDYDNLYQLYVVEKMSTTDIGDIYSKDSSTVLYHLKKYGINRTIKESQKTKRTKEKISKAAQGENNSMWNGGVKKMKGGYIGLYKPEHLYSNSQGYVLKHRLVFEKYLGRKLKPEEIVHHIDGNPTNNKLSNLELFENQSAHAKDHYTEREINKEGQFVS